MKLEWHFNMSGAPSGRPILLLLGETIPGMPDIRVGSHIDAREVEVLWGEEGSWSDGGWLIWNSANDWFVVASDAPLAWSPAELPDLSERRAAA